MEDNLLKLDPPPDSGKKPYTPPCLTVHGTVQDVTAGQSGGLPDADGSLGQQEQ